MKRRWLSGLLCALMLLQLTLPARAAGTIYFVAAEESVLPVTDAAMPFWKNGYLYVSASVFTSLGISIIHNSAKQLTILEKNRRALLFDWAKGTAQDSNGNVISPGVIQSGGVVFVPVSAVADFFSLLYSVTEVARGYLIWLRSPGFGMGAKDFANAATYNIEARYTAYLRDSQAAALPSVPSGTDSVPSGTQIRLCIEADSRTAALLNALDRSIGHVTFYCTPDFLETQGDLLRRMVASGHGIGILIAGDGADALQQIQRGNEALCRAAFSKTRLIYLPAAPEETAQALRQAGYCPLSPALDRSRYQLESSANASALLSRISARRKDTTVWLGATDSAAGLREFLSAARQAGHYCRALTETD